MPCLVYFMNVDHSIEFFSYYCAVPVLCFHLKAISITIDVFLFASCRLWREVYTNVAWCLSLLSWISIG